MRFFWRNSAAPLADHADWVVHVDRKNRQPGTSAPTLAASWSGPLDLLGALAMQPALAGITVQQAMVEAKATFDSHGGNVRNHDLVLHATTQTDESVVTAWKRRPASRWATLSRSKSSEPAAPNDSTTTLKLPHGLMIYSRADVGTPPTMRERTRFDTSC